jgi:hypothetical protein
MPAYYDDIDCSFGYCGDFQLSAGDIKDTRVDGLQSVLDQIHSICTSTAGDWAIYPNRGASINDFVGEPNTRYTGNRLQERISMAIINSRLVNSSDLNIRVVPVHIHKVLVIIRIQALPTPFNQLNEGQILQTTMVFDSLEQEVFFLDKTPQLINQ